MSQLGDWFNTVAVYALLYEITGSATAVAGMMVVQFLPIAVVAALAAGTVCLGAGCSTIGYYGQLAAGQHPVLLCREQPVPGVRLEGRSPGHPPRVPGPAASTARPVHRPPSCGRSSCATSTPSAPTRTSRRATTCAMRRTSCR